MTSPIIGVPSTECDYCGTWHKISAPVCPRCEHPNPEYLDKVDRIANIRKAPTPVAREKVYEDD